MARNKRQQVFEEIERRKAWKQVDVQGNLHSAVWGDRAGRVERDGGQYEARIGRRRAGPPRHWTWEVVGRFDGVYQAQEAVEARMPAEK